MTTPPLSAASVSGLAPSPDEDDHLTIKKLKTQHSQGSVLHASTPSIQVQPAIFTSPRALIVDLGESDDEQGLHSELLDQLVESITNVLAPSEQPHSSAPILVL